VFVHSTNHKGAVAEAKIAAEAIALGIPVLKPIAEHGCYDLAFDLGSRVLRVQCKWGALQGDVISARIGRSRHTPRGYVVRTYSATEIDAFGIYCGDLDRGYLVPIHVAPEQHALHLRIEAPKNAQRASLHWAADYELGAVAQLAERSDGIRKVRGSNPLSSIPCSETPSEVEVGAHQFRNHFGYYMERAAAGTEILIRRHGKPFARLGPPQPAAV
jgi:prevent-host-death family protein